METKEENLEIIIIFISKFINFFCHRYLLNKPGEVFGTPGNNHLVNRSSIVVSAPVQAWLLTAWLSPSWSFARSLSRFEPPDIETQPIDQPLF